MKRKKRLPAWTPFAEAMLPVRGEKKLAKELGTTVDAIRAIRDKTDRVYLNSRYQVNVKYQVPFAEIGEVPVTVTYLSIKRRDKRPIHDWRDLQRIKNEIVGEENEGFELYPAESRLCDTANQYHLWVFEDPTFRLPVGFTARTVSGESRGGARQRPF